MRQNEEFIESQRYAIELLTKISESAAFQHKKAEIKAHIKQLRLIRTALVNYNTKQETPS